MRTELSKLHQKLQTTTIYVTHDQTEAMTMASRLVVMKDGIIQQIGTPKDVYENPKIVFVGGFIGSPAMNFFDGRIGDNKLVIGDTYFKIPDDKLLILRDQYYIGKEVIFGIRPEDIHNALLNSSENTGFDAKVNVFELTGAESLIYSTLAKKEFVARLDSNVNLAAGVSVQLKFDMYSGHFFDKDTELQIH